MGITTPATGIATSEEMWSIRCFISSGVGAVMIGGETCANVKNIDW